MSIVRVNTDGTLDTSFGTGGRATIGFGQFRRKRFGRRNAAEWTNRRRRRLRHSELSGRHNSAMVAFSGRRPWPRR